MKNHIERQDNGENKAENSWYGDVIINATETYK